MLTIILESFQLQNPQRYIYRFNPQNYFSSLIVQTPTIFYFLPKYNFRDKPELRGAAKADICNFQKMRMIRRYSIAL
jgi:hypothetical protein